MIALVIVLVRKISDSSKDDVNDYSHKDDVPVTLPRFFVSDNYWLHFTFINKSFRISVSEFFWEELFRKIAR